MKSVKICLLAPSFFILLIGILLGRVELKGVPTDGCVLRNNSEEESILLMINGEPINVLKPFAAVYLKGYPLKVDNQIALKAIDGKLDEEARIGAVEYLAGKPSNLSIEKLEIKNEADQVVYKLSGIDASLILRDIELDRWTDVDFSNLKGWLKTFVQAVKRRDEKLIASCFPQNEEDPELKALIDFLASRDSDLVSVPEIDGASFVRGERIILVAGKSFEPFFVAQNAKTATTKRIYSISFGVHEGKLLMMGAGGRWAKLSANE